MKFIKAFFLAFFAASVLYVSAVLICIDAPVPAEYWVAEMITVKKELAKEYAGRRKIIVAGGSSTLFGISAEQASAQLKMPVINYGLHAGLRLEKILQEVSPYAERGDILVLPLEPGYYGCNTKLTSWQVANIIGWDHAAWKEMSLVEKGEFIASISPSQFGQMIIAEFQKKFFPEKVSHRLETMDEKLVLSKFRARTAPEKLSYSAYNFNNHGDLLRTEGSQYAGPGLHYSDPNQVCSTTAGYLSRFVETMKNKGVQVYFSNVPYIASGEGLDALRSSETNFRNALSRAGALIDRREDLIFDRKYFLDAILHLNAEGRTLRTDLFVKSMRRIVSAKPASTAQVDKNSIYSKYAALPVVDNPEAATKPILWLDVCNNKLVSSQGEIVIDKTAGRLECSGWVIDPRENTTADRVFVQVNEEYFAADYGAPRPGVAEYFKNPRLTDSGFKFSLDASKFEDAAKISFLVVSQNKTYQYRPVDFWLERR